MAAAFGTVTLGSVRSTNSTGTSPPRADRTSAGAESAPAERSADESTPDRVSSIVAAMSLRQKVGQLFVTVAHGATADAPHPGNREDYGVDTPAEVVREFQLGGVIHFSWTDSLREPRQIAELSNDLQRTALDSGAGIPLTIATDQEQGAVTRIGEPATALPGNMALGAARDPHRAAQAADVTGRELRAMGITQNFAPVGDVNVDPENPVIGVRSFGSDPELVAGLTRAQVRGHQDFGSAANTVSATVKHFPGHGDTSVDSHTALPVVDHTAEQWRRLDAPPFRAAIAAGTDSVMTAHIKFPRLDDSGEPATLSREILTGMLREELGFAGVVVTDSLRMEGVLELHPNEPVSVLAFRAGADQLLMPRDLGSAIESVVAAVRSGELSERDVDRSVTRILRMKERRGLLDDPLVDPNAVGRVVGSERNAHRARRITDSTVTVLRNDSGLLPLRERPRDVLVTGWGTDAVAELARLVRKRGPRAEALPTGSSPDSGTVERVTSLAQQHEAVIVLTNAAWKESNSAQRDLLRSLGGTRTPVIAVAVRDPYDAAYAEQVRTWLATYSHRTVSLESLARVLFGEVAPVGKLPVPVPDPLRPGKDRYPFGHGVTW
ncbi:glycoside hydrolase family 3 protein [Actinopolyspora sp. BKK1]|nr:glycoside hydrolase family 3 protein [Actinopolyspora sp. BKK2]NHE78301.1 glycoside hydrolase family 3 protein [Actinopolyspora sp. BKK1]